MIKLRPLAEAKKEEKVTLYYKEGGSDKVYTAILQPKDDGWVVNAQWGRRGSSMQTGTKTKSPVSYEKAKEIYNKLVDSKMAKGYQPGKTGTVYTADADKESRRTGTNPQLLNPIDDEELERYLTDNSYGTQEKHDGKRILIDINEDATYDDGADAVSGVIGINRKGLAVELPKEISKEVGILKGELLDGELVGDKYFVFDLLKHKNKGIYTWPYKRRYDTLSALPFKNNVILVDLAVGEKAKREMFKYLKANNREGIVFKDLVAPYKAGRPLRGGTQLKYKFWESTTAEVSRINQKRSVGLKVLDNSGNGYIDVGNVTIPPNKEIPEVGDMVEIRYLYAYKGGSLYQPIYLGVRDDKDTPDKESQLKFKND